MIRIRRLSAAEGRHHLPALGAVLVDCVEGGASVSFMAPFSQADAESFFATVLDEVEKGRRILLAAFVSNELAGTLQIVTALPPNQPHRAELAKMLVRRDARRQGLAARLLEHAEAEARLAGKTLLTLDTVTGQSAERLYQRLGWNKAGVIPNYALFPDGRFCDTTIFWKSLA